MGVRNCEEFGIILQNIANALMKNTNLCKLLYYTDTDPLGQTKIDPTKAQIFGKNIRIIPKVGTDETEKNTVVLMLKSADHNSNDEFQNLILSIYVYTPLTQWIINDDNLRPFKILGEIQKSLYKKRVGGIGVLTGGGFDLDMLTDEMSCYVMEFDLDVFA